MTAAQQETDCPAGHYCSGGLPTACADGKFAAAGTNLAAACADPTSGTANAACKVYADAARANCAISAVGYVKIAQGTPLAIASVTKCVANCDECNAQAVAGTSAKGECTKAAAGYVITGSGATADIISCGDGCHTCTASAATPPVITCTKAKAGWALGTAAPFTPTLCAAGKGTASDAHILTACTDCTAAKNCSKCSLVDICTAC